MVVDTDAVCAAIKDVFQDTRSMLEPAGALGVAGAQALRRRSTARPAQTYVAITCGANMNFDRLRFVAERAEEREALFAVTIPEERGSFRRFSELIGDRGRHRVQLPHLRQRPRPTCSSASPIADRTDVGRHRPASSPTTASPTVDLTHDELAKEHVRHMVGGRSPLADDERLYRFLFPERPGALMRFLSAMRPDWNISLFHYRNQGADYGRVLVGLQVPRDRRRRVRRRSSSSSPTRTRTRPTARSTACSSSRRPGRDPRARAVRRPGASA